MIDGFKGVHSQPVRLYQIGDPITVLSEPAKRFRVVGLIHEDAATGEIESYRVRAHEHNHTTEYVLGPAKIEPNPARADSPADPDFTPTF